MLRHDIDLKLIENFREEQKEEKMSLYLSNVISGRTRDNSNSKQLQVKRLNFVFM